ncbi:MAG: hypothetical protein ACLTW9_25560 [Enterocloster sp.]
MKNPFTKLIHHYTYDMRLKTKLVISHIILVLLPTAVLSGFSTCAFTALSWMTAYARSRLSVRPDRDLH